MCPGAGFAWKGVVAVVCSKAERWRCSQEQARFVTRQGEEDCVVRLNMKVTDWESQENLDQDRGVELAGRFGNSLADTGVRGKAPTGLVSENHL